MHKAIINLRDEWNEENMKSLIKAIIECFLKNDKNFEQNTYIKKKEKVSIEFDKKGYASCLPFKGTLSFGNRIFTHSYRLESTGYKRERKFIKKRCGNDKVKIFIWVVVHEYSHFFKNMMQHTHEFYEFVDENFVKLLWYILETTE